jgi:hypothetical protein
VLNNLSYENGLPVLPEAASTEPAAATEPRTPAPPESLREDLIAIRATLAQLLTALERAAGK